VGFEIGLKSADSGTQKVAYRVGLGERKMDKTEFETAIDSIEFDPRKRLKSTVAGIVERELAGVPADVADLILPPRLQSLSTRAKDAIESGHSDRLEGLLIEFASDLDRVVAWEKSAGALKPLTVSSECKRVAGRLGANLWNGFEIAQLVSVLTSDDLPIGEINYREIKTAARTIERGFHEVTRPAGYSVEFWRNCGTSEHEINAAEASDARELAAAKKPFSDYSGPHTKPAGAD
jgi:hypothetical protein